MYEIWESKYFSSHVTLANRKKIFHGWIFQHIMKQHTSSLNYFFIFFKWLSSINTWRVTRWLMALYLFTKTNFLSPITNNRQRFGSVWEGPNRNVYKIWNLNRTMKLLNWTIKHFSNRQIVKTAVLWFGFGFQLRSNFNF